MIQNIKNIYVCIYVKKKTTTTTTTKTNKLPAVAVTLLKKKIQAHIYYLHFNKNFITLDLKIQAFEAERISYGRMFNLSAIP